MVGGRRIPAEESGGWWAESGATGIIEYDGAVAEYGGGGII